MAGADVGVWMLQGLSLKAGGADPSQDQLDLQIQSAAVAGSCARNWPRSTPKAGGSFALPLRFMFNLDVLITCNIDHINNS